MDVMVIQEVLKGCGRELDIRVAIDGEAALVLLDDWAPQLVLLDLNVPKVPGLEVLAEIRKRQDLKDIPVVIVTSSDSSQDYRAAEKFKVAAYFRKPTSLTEFMSLANIVQDVLPSAPDSND